MELSKNRLSQYSRLKSRKQRLDQGLFIVEGEKSVADTLSSYELKALILEEGYSPKTFETGDMDSEKIFTASESAMKKLSSFSTASHVAAVYCLPETGGDEQYGTLTPDLYLMLDGIQDPGNLGTIIRTAHWFGIRRIFASRDTADIYNPKTIQATMGSLPHVRVDYASLSEILTANSGLPVYGLLLDGEDIHQAPLGKTGFIVMGNEGKGISGEIRRLVTNPLLIPPYYPEDHSESLNVAIATGITLSYFRR